MLAGFEPVEGFLDEPQFGVVQAAALGVATESGVVGDRIVVQNLDSREKLLAEVIGPGVVRALF